MKLSDMIKWQLTNSKMNQTKIHHLILVDNKQEDKLNEQLLIKKKIREGHKKISKNEY